MTAELTKVYLVGSLGKAMGISEWELDVRSPAEAIRAININLGGALERYLAGPARERLYRVAIQKRDNTIGGDELNHRSGRSPIFIIPSVRGRNSGLGKVITGIVLIAAAFLMPETLAAWPIFGSSLTVGSALVAFGVPLVLGGISQMLTPTPQGITTQPDQASSTSFQGNATSVVQGGCVPVVYGRALVAPVPVSITISNNDVSTSAAGTNGAVDITPLPGGGTQYGPAPN